MRAIVLVAVMASAARAEKPAALDREATLGDVKLSDQPDKRADAARWRLFREERGAAYYRREGEALRYKGLLVGEIIYIESKRGKGITNFVLNFSGPRCGELRKLLEAEWGESSEIQRDWVEWRGRVVSAALRQTGNACQLTVDDLKRMLEDA